MKLFCRHIWKMEREEYNYTTYRLYYDVFFHKFEHYIQYFKCVKCSKEKIEETAREVQLTLDEKLTNMVKK
jgi:hypothetical protein